MERIGYDSDTGRYYFRDSSGAVYEGAQGAQFSAMTRGASLLRGMTNTHIIITVGYPPGDVEAARRADGYQPLATNAVRLSPPLPSSLSSSIPQAGHRPTSAYRTLFPFFLLIAVFLLLVWRLILSPGLAPPPNPCPAGAKTYLVQPGDSCWEISRAHGLELAEFMRWNQAVECERLMPGSTVCLPDKE